MRFRLGRTEVADLGTNGRIEETVNFGPGDQNNFITGWNGQTAMGLRGLLPAAG
ncbi:MAG: hypothetical protein IPG67_09780 [Acidobacteria bacterium]|nr:hypothetical protein [Acidobacteriota bacterium]